MARRLAAGCIVAADKLVPLCITPLAAVLKERIALRAVHDLWNLNDLVYTARFWHPPVRAAKRVLRPPLLSAQRFLALERRYLQRLPEHPLDTTSHAIGGFRVGRRFCHRTLSNVVTRVVFPQWLWMFPLGGRSCYFLEPRPTSYQIILYQNSRI